MSWMLRHSVLIEAVFAAGVLVSASLSAETSFPGSATIPLLAGEHWWGGAAAFGTSMPFDEKTDIVLELARNNYDNASAPFLVSDRGRSVFCTKPPRFVFRNSELSVECPGGEILLDASAATLREAFVRLMKRYSPSGGS